MGLFAIGDVQGCDHELGLLLKKIRFSADRDRLWLVGDLVNRGPDSLRVLRRLRSMRDNVAVTLGNHDLHLLAVAFKVARSRKSDTLDDLLQAHDRDALLDEITAWPFMHEDRTLNLAMLHAGLPPQWTMATARQCAQEAQRALRKDPRTFVAHMYGNDPGPWDEALAGAARLRFITNCFTRLRFLDADGGLEFEEKSAPGVAVAENLQPWFVYPGARWRGTRIVFGHWSTLGFFRNEDVIGLDTGCAWGNQLTALRLDVPDAQPVSIECARR